MAFLQLTHLYDYLTHTVLYRVDLLQNAFEGLHGRIPRKAGCHSLDSVLELLCGEAGSMPQRQTPYLACQPSLLF